MLVDVYNVVLSMAMFKSFVEVLGRATRGERHGKQNSEQED